LDSLHVVLCEQVILVGHGFEFQTVSGGILEEHRPLFSFLSWESQLWLDYEFGSCLDKPIPELIPLLKI
jgi:hypothetical protein